LLRTSAIKKPIWFLISGAAAVFIDWGAFYLLDLQGSLRPWAAKLISYIAGALCSFVLNGIMTFKSRLSIRALSRHLKLYISSLALNILVLEVFLKTDTSLLINSKATGVLFATLFSMTLNYLGMALYVFPNKSGLPRHE
jgi:putative flippase GtrA